MQLAYLMPKAPLADPHLIPFLLVNQMVEGAPGVKVRGPELQTSKSGGKWKWILLGVAAAGGAGAGVYFGTRTTSSSPVSISTGAVVFGSPR